jgi:hypothetical protein
MPTQVSQLPSTFGQLLVKSSAQMAACGILIEEQLKRTLDVADKCSSELSLVVADTLTKLTRDVAAAPLFFAEQSHADGKQMRHIVQVTAYILHKVQPEQARSPDALDDAIERATRTCRRYGLDKKVQGLFGMLIKEIANVFYELRAILKRQGTPQTKTLYKSVGSFMRDIRQPILCFAYNALKLRVCMDSLGNCGPKSKLEKETVRKILKNVNTLSRQARTMAVMSPYNKSTVTQAMALLKN